MNYNDIAPDLIKNLRAEDVSYGAIAKYLGMSRPTFNRRRRTNTFTTQELNRLYEMGNSILEGRVEETTTEADAYPRNKNGGPFAPF